MERRKCLPRCITDQTLQFFVDQLCDPAWDENAFGQLVLPSSQKDLVCALVATHIERSSTFDDIVKGKGRGLIMVLHGPPGVGQCRLSVTYVSASCEVMLCLGLCPEDSSKATTGGDTVHALLKRVNTNVFAGKTLTAETVAEYCKRPLYSVSAGDLGTTAPELDKCLSRILDMATTWKAVLLIDEADVFLEKRSLHDLQRNSLVSIFLRLLEYYR